MERNKITYYYDALCGWCYGFSDVVQKLQNTYQSSMDFDVISGGLFLEPRVGLINQVAPYIKNGAYKQVEATTGIMFGEGFLNKMEDDNQMTLNSILPAIALCIVKENQPDKTLEFANILKKAIYRDGLDPIHLEGFAKYAEMIGFEADDFNFKMKDEKYRIAAQKEFDFFQSTGVGSFPALVLETEKGKVLLSKGYTSFQEINSRLTEYLNSN